MRICFYLTFNFNEIYKVLKVPQTFSRLAFNKTFKWYCNNKNDNFMRQLPNNRKKVIRTEQITLYTKFRIIVTASSSFNYSLLRQDWKWVVSPLSPGWSLEARCLTIVTISSSNSMMEQDHQSTRVLIMFHLPPLNSSTQLPRWENFSKWREPLGNGGISMLYYLFFCYIVLISLILYLMFTNFVRLQWKLWTTEK